MAAKSVLNFGKYKGHSLDSLPSNYLQWMTVELDNHWNALARQVLSNRGEAPRTSGTAGVGSMVLTFGKYKGRALGSLPDVYLEWMAENMHTHWGRHAKEFLENKLPVQVRTEEDPLSSLKEQILACRDLQEAKRIHSRVLASAYHKDRYMSNLLVGMYGSCGSVENALQVFHTIKAPNTFSWNIVLKVCTQNGWFDKAREVFEKIPDKSAVSWNTMLAALASEKGKLFEVEELFERMPIKDVFSWTTLLNAYTRNGRLEQAKAIFDRLDERNVNVATWNTMLEGYAQSGHIEEARRLFDGMQEKTIVSWNLMIAAYGREKKVEEARRLFDGVLEKNQVTWNAMLAVYARNGHAEEAVHLFRELPMKDDVSWTCLVQAHSQAGEVKELEEVLEAMPCEKTMVHWTMLLDAHARAGNIERAREVYDRMPSPDAIATNSMLSAYAQRGYMHEAVALFDGAGDRVDTVSRNVMILAYAMNGECEAAKQLFDRMAHRDIYLWTSLVRGLSVSSMYGDAFRLFRCMVLEGLSPNQEALVHAIAAGGNACTLDEMRSFFANMSLDYGVSPSLDHYDCMVGVLGAAKKMTEARELIETMPFEGDARVWMTLLACCRRHSDAANGQVSAEQVFVLEPGNVSAYMILAEIYSRTGRQKEIAALKKAVKDKGLSKVAAESLIRVGGKTHKFRVGDTSHPSIKQVRKEVARLTKLIEKEGYKHENLGGGIHSEKLGIAYGLLTGSKISLVNNLRTCGDCHTCAKLISSAVNKKITVRDTQRLHYFENGVCSCADTW